MSWVDDKVTVLNPTLSTVIRTFGSNGSTDGKFQNPWGITIANGVVYVTDTQLSRVQAFDLNGVFLGKWGGLGTGPYQFNNPAGITHDAAGNLYIADSANDRIQVYSTTVPKPTGDNRKPVVTIASPTDGRHRSGRRAADHRHGDGHGTVRRGEGRGLGQEHRHEPLVEPADGHLDWRRRRGTRPPAVRRVDHEHDVCFTFNGVRTAGTTTRRCGPPTSRRSAPRRSRPSTSPPRGRPGDQLTPVTSITAPAIDATVPPGNVTFQGAAGDNVGVTQVQVSIMDRNTNRMFDPGTGTFINGPKIWIPATVATPGALETTWSYVFTGGAAGSGSYYVLSRGLDAAGNIQTDSPFTRYTVAGVSDTVPPDTTITAPTAGQAVPAGTVGIAGNATDNVGVASVAVSIRDDVIEPVVGRRRRGSARQQWLAASIFSPGGTSTGWSYSWASPGARAVHGLRAGDRRRRPTSTRSPASNAFTVLPADTTVADDDDLVAGEQLVGQPADRHGGTAADDVGRRGGAGRDPRQRHAPVVERHGLGRGRLVRQRGARHARRDVDGLELPVRPGRGGQLRHPGQGRGHQRERRREHGLAELQRHAPRLGHDRSDDRAHHADQRAVVAVRFGERERDVHPTRPPWRRSASRSRTRRRSQWWNGSGWVPATTFVNATLDTPGGTSTGYTYTFSPGVQGNYAVQVRGVDSIGNLGNTIGPRAFTIQPVFVDTTAPTTTVSAPLNNSTVAAPVVMSGSATDDVGVTVVRVSIQDTVSKLWWNGSAWGAFTFVTATLDNPGGTSTGWSYSFSPPATGKFGFQARALDAAANLGANTVWRVFTIS